MKKTYVKPNMKTINIKAGQILCGSGSGIDPTVEPYDAYQQYAE